MKMNTQFLAQMREAAALLQTSGPAAATEAIQRALHGNAVPETAPSMRTGIAQPAPIRDINPPAQEQPEANAGAGLLAKFRTLRSGKWSGSATPQTIEDVETEVTSDGKFMAGSLTNAAGTRAYKLYVPSAYDGTALPLVVMLHGCKQNPDDFAAGTGMNRIAEENNCLVVYPAQVKRANGSNCWNWFQAGDQRRDQGEPSIIADITREIMRTHKVDAGRVYVAGLSAGGAMAAIMAATYPELYAAVGIHSGLPYGAAQDLPSAFAAMKNGMNRASSSDSAPNAHTVPVIVFHGDRDAIVHPRNGEQALNQGPADHAEVMSEKGETAQGRSYTRTVRRDSSGKINAEQWLVHGAGHAWSGGSSKGSYTDPQGPDASREMMRFFLGR